MKNPVTQERLKELLHYDPQTGVFTWNVANSNAIKVGSVAGGTKNSTGYRFIKVDGRMYMAHRLAWLYMTGSYPDRIVDHKSRDFLDNSWGNLRLATDTESARNQGKKHNNTSGVKGVCLHPISKKWVATLNYDGKRRHLGTYEDIEAAKQFIELIRNMFHGDFVCNA